MSPGPNPGVAKLGLADQALANLLGCVAVQAIRDDRTELSIGSIAELLPHANRSAPMMARIAEASAEILNAWAARHQRGDGSVRWCAACLHASGVVEEFLFWRAGLALDAWREAQAKREDAA